MDVGMYDDMLWTRASGCSHEWVAVNCAQYPLYCLWYVGIVSLFAAVSDGSGMQCIESVGFGWLRGMTGTTLALPDTSRINIVWRLQAGIGYKTTWGVCLAVLYMWLIQLEGMWEEPVEVYEETGYARCGRKVQARTGVCWRIGTTTLIEMWTMTLEAMDWTLCEGSLTWDGSLDFAELGAVRYHFGNCLVGLLCCLWLPGCWASVYSA